MFQLSGHHYKNNSRGGKSQAFVGDGQDEYGVHTNHLYTGRGTQVYRGTQGNHTGRGVWGHGLTGMFGNLDQLTSLLAEFPTEKIIVYEFQNGGQTIASTVFQSYQVQTLHLIMLLQSTPENM